MLLTSEMVFKSKRVKDAKKKLVKTFSKKSFRNIYENLPGAKKPEETYKNEIKMLMWHFLNKVFEKFSKTYPSIPELETYKNKTCLNSEFTKSPVSFTSWRPLQKKIRETLPFLNKIKKTPSPHLYPSPDSFQVWHPKKIKKKNFRSRLPISFVQDFETPNSKT